jgi:type VII secretion integral membrane protein EccD
VRVTVTSRTRRVDLVLPDAVSVAELVPELARCVGLLDVATAHAGYRAVTRDGRVLRPDGGLTAQGVEHGDVITIAAAAHDEPAAGYDDMAEAMTDVVERDVEPWGRAPRGWAVLWSAIVLLLLGAGALVTERGTESASSASSAALALSVVLVISAALFSRLRDETLAAVSVGNLACVFAAVAGWCWSRHTSLSGTSLTLAGGGVVGAGLSVALGMGKARVLLLPGVVAGAACLATGLLMQATTLDPALPLTTVLALVVISSSGFPALALSASGAGRHALSGTRATSDSDGLRIDMARLAADARLAREILVAASATAGLLLVVLAPVAVSCGQVGAAVPVLGCAVVMLRTRRYRSALDVLVGVSSGVFGLVSTVVSWLWLYGSWRLPTAMVVVASGVVLLGHALWPHHGVRPHGQAADRLEAAALAALLPVLLATGLAAGKL